MRQHTPGPWQIDDFLHRSNGAIWAEDGMEVCHVRDRGGCTPANARLIAAAPDLLEAVDELVAAVLALPPSYLEAPYVASRFHLAMRALAKARGEVMP